MFSLLASRVPLAGFKWTRIWKEQLNTQRTEFLDVLKFDLEDGFFAEMRQNKLFSPNESESIEGSTTAAARANLWFKALESRSAESILKWIERLKKYPQHETLAAELQNLYNVSVASYYENNATNTPS